MFDFNKIFGLIFLAVALYLGFAFILCEVNPIKWHDLVKILYCICIYKIISELE